MKPQPLVMDARKAVIAREQERYEFHAEREQALVFEGLYGEAEAHHKAAILLAWALCDEADPKGDRLR